MEESLQPEYQGLSFAQYLAELTRKAKVYADANALKLKEEEDDRGGR